MAITVQAQPATLTWGNFVPQPTRPTDPNDGTLVDAFTAFNFNMPSRPPRTISGQFAMADPNTITITPNAQVFANVAQTQNLLSHEQFHYDVGIVTARAFARHLMRLRTPTIADLRIAIANTTRLHMQTRAGLLQSRYDKDTRHGTNQHAQRIWKRRMAACLANPRSSHIGGFWL